MVPSQAAAEKKEEVKEVKAKSVKGKAAKAAPAPAPEPAKEELRERRNSGDAPKEQRNGKYHTNSIHTATHTL